EQDARVTGKGHEELDVGLGERADVAEALTDDEQAEGSVLTAEWRDDRVLEATGTKESVECTGGTAPREQRRRADGGDLGERGGILRREPLLRMHEQLALSAADAPQRPALVRRRQEQNFRVLGAQQPPGGH